jgi:hypothetical protein
MYLDFFDRCAQSTNITARRMNIRLDILLISQAKPSRHVIDKYDLA